MTTSNDAANVAYEAIGRAVVASQALEILFALIVRLVFKQGGVALKDDIQPLEKNFSKASTAALLQELRRYVAVNQDFERTLLAFLDRRHTLIHRWGIEYGLPEDAAGQEKIASFCRELTNDAVGLFTVLNTYMVEWMRKFPEFAEAPGAEAALRLLPIPEHLRALTIEVRPDE
jgi:hypothetical protein